MELFVGHKSPGRCPAAQRPTAQMETRIRKRPSWRHARLIGLLWLAMLANGEVTTSPYPERIPYRQSDPVPPVRNSSAAGPIPLRSGAFVPRLTPPKAVV